MYLLIDPVLLAIPEDRHNVEENIRVQRDFATHLLDWEDETRRKQHHFFIGEEYLDALYEDGSFPDKRTLQQRWGQLGLLHLFSVDAAAAVVRRIIENTPYLEGVFPDLGKVDVDDVGFLVNPDLLARLTDNVRAIFLCALGRVAWVRTHPPAADQGGSSPDPADLLLVTHPIGQEPAAMIQAGFRVQPGVTLNADLPLVTTPEDLDTRQSVMDLWRDPVKAIELQVQTMIQGNDLPTETALLPFAVGPDLVASLERFKLDRTPGRLSSIYRKFAMLVTDTLAYDKKEHHVIKEITAHQPWRAWRLWLSADSSAFRLLYWRDEKQIILMHVRSSATHDDNKIDAPPSDLPFDQQAKKSKNKKKGR